MEAFLDTLAGLFALAVLCAIPASIALGIIYRRNP